MIVDAIKIQHINGQYNVSLTLKRSEIQVEELEGTGDTLAEAMYDLGDYLMAVNV